MLESILKIVKDLGPGRILALGGVVLASLGFFFYMSERFSTPPMNLLYGDLEPADSSAIVSRLEGMNVPYQLSDDGRFINAPANQISKLRLDLAEQGLPAGGSVGYELFDNFDSMGTTSFVQNINKLRALEGELSRTISSIKSINSARVHLVLPQRELFSRKNPEPSASVTVRMLGGRQLSPQQVLGIQHLVAAAVPKLSPTKVSIIDGRGNLLAKPNGEGEVGLQFTNTDEKQTKYEKQLANNIEELLGRYVGLPNVRAEVRATMDFDRITESSEIYDPDGQVARSTQVVDQKEVSQEGAGNDDVSIGGNLPNADANSDGQSSSNQVTRVEEITNYEISKTIRQHVKEGGKVKQLSVAVLIDGTYSTNGEGKREYKKRTDDELQKLTALVKSAIGFEEERGDKIEVVNLQFANGDEEAKVAEPEGSSMSFSKGDIMHIAELAILAVITLLVIFLVVKPLLKYIASAADNQEAKSVSGEVVQTQAMLNTAEGGAGGGAEGEVQALEDKTTGEGEEMQALPTNQEIDNMIDMNQVEGQVRESSLKKIGDLVENHPEESTSIIRNWIYEAEEQHG